MVQCMYECLSMHFILLIPTSRCQHTCSTTHQNISEPAIIFLQAPSCPRAYSTGSLLYQLTPPATAAAVAATRASITELHSWLQIINTEQSGHFRAGSTWLRGEDHTQQRQDIDCHRQVSCNQGNSTLLSVSMTQHYKHCRVQCITVW